MTQNITRTYDGLEHARGAVNALKARGFTDEQISLVAHAGEPENHPPTRESSADQGPPTRSVNLGVVSCGASWAFGWKG